LELVGADIPTYPLKDEMKEQKGQHDRGNNFGLMRELYSLG
jgi:hypothetical protein